VNRQGEAGAIVPLTMSREQSLEYTGLSRKLFVQLEKAGSLTGRRYGPNGAVIFQTAQLQQVVANLFGGETDMDYEMSDLMRGDA